VSDFLAIAFWVAVIWGTFVLIGRVNEFLKTQKTARRFNDFGDRYYDYNHNIWALKYVPKEVVATTTIPRISVNDFIKAKNGTA